MEIQKGTIVEILPTDIWYEKDMFGTVRLKMQHQGEKEPFTFISMGYNYMYTSNSHQHEMIKKIGELLGVENILQKQSVEEWKTQIKNMEDKAVAWRWSENNGETWFEWKTDFENHDKAKEMNFLIEYAYAENDLI